MSADEIEDDECNPTAKNVFIFLIVAIVAESSTHLPSRISNVVTCAAA
jgi:hypothetical protein